MKKKSLSVSTISAPLPVSYTRWKVFLWLMFWANSLFLVWSCLDRYLAPRFFFLSATIMLALLSLWKDLREKSDVRLNGFDALLLGWYGLNLASVSWSMSWSEGIFYAQKTLLLFLCYWLVKQALFRKEEMVQNTLKQATLALSIISALILMVQIGVSVSEKGFNNDSLYDYASGVFGNKSLAAEFLFFLFIFNVYFYKKGETKWIYWPLQSALLLLILLLQVRTVFVALALGGILYLVIRATIEQNFSKTALRKTLPAALLVCAMVVGFLVWKGQGSSLLERLNPLTYMESASANERRFVWYKTDLLNAEHFWLGVGDGSWKFWFPSKSIGGGYRIAEENVVFTRAHNDYLEIRAEMGIIGAGWFILLFLAAAVPLFLKGWRNSSYYSSRALLGAAISGYCVIQYFDFPRERIEFQVVLAVLFAFSAHGARSFWDKLPGVSLGSYVSPFLMACLMGAGFNLVVGWERMRGEIYNVQLLEAQSKSDWQKVVTASVKAENPFYEYTDVAVPLSWHEGIAWFQMGQFEKSATAFEKAYRMNPWNFQVINNYATALVKTNRLKEAIPLFEKALSINPRYDEGKFNLSYVYLELQDYPRSLEWLSKVDTIANPSNDGDRAKNKATLLKYNEFKSAILKQQGVQH